MPNTWYLNFTSAKSDGTLPIKNRAIQFRYRKFLFWTVDLFDSGLSDDDARGSWTIEIVNESETVVLFKQTVTLYFSLLAFGASGVYLFTWRIVKENIDTTQIGGASVTEETVGQYLLGGTKESEQGILDPASGADSTDRTATISTAWTSPIYLLTKNGRSGFPKGAKVRISKDTWRLGGTRTLTYQFAILEGGTTQLDATFGRMGDLLVSRPIQDERVQMTRAWSPRNYGYLEAGGSIPGVVVGIRELSDGRILQVIQDDSGVREYLTKGGSDLFVPALYPNRFGEMESADIWSSDSEMATFLVTKSRDRIHLEVSGNQMYTRTVTRSGLGERTLVGEAPDGIIPALVERDDSVFEIIGEDALPIFESRRFPPQWVPVSQGVPV